MGFLEAVLNCLARLEGYEDFTLSKKINPDNSGKAKEEKKYSNKQSGDWRESKDNYLSKIELYPGQHFTENLVKKCLDKTKTYTPSPFIDYTGGYSQRELALGAKALKNLKPINVGKCIDDNFARENRNSAPIASKIYKRWP
jgi:hypothetical protein